MKYFSFIFILMSPIFVMALLFFIDIDESMHNKSNLLTIITTLIIYYLNIVIVISSLKDKVSTYMPKDPFIKYILLVFLDLIMLCGLFEIEIQNPRLEWSVNLLTLGIIILIHFIFMSYVSALKYENFLKKLSFFKIENNKNSISIKDSTDNKYWAKLEKIFIDNHKKESLSILKKYNFTEEYKVDANSESIKNIFHIKHIIDVLHILQESLLNILENEKINDENIKSKRILSEAIFVSKYIYYKMALKLLKSIFNNLSNFFRSLMLIYIVALALLYYFPQEVNITNILTLNIELYLFSLSLFIGYAIYFLLKLFTLTNYPDSKHNNWKVVSKNLLYLFVSFFIFMGIIVYTIAILKESVEFQQLFHYVTNLILPTLSITDVLTFMSLLNIESDIVPIIIFFKLIIITAFFIVVTIILKHFMEKYIELYEKLQKSTYSVPPEFLKFFGYIILFILTVILLYGTLFINYPTLEKEYATCKTYVSKNNKTLANCTKEHLSEDEEKYCKYINTLKPSSKLEFDKCEIGILLNDASNNSSVNSVLAEKDKTSLSDYIPLSMFLTFFGAIMMISSKNLVENYFHGVSLKINPPYEEGERVTIDNGEMLSVEDIGFRATTFYGISTNTHLVIPHQKLTQSTIKNYTQPTLNYREKISINIPDSSDNQSGMNNPRDAEHMLLLAAYISTGVKIPKINTKELKELKKLTTDYMDSGKDDIRISDGNAKLAEIDKDKKDTIDEIYTYVNDNVDIQKSLFILKIYKISKKSTTDNEFEVTKKIIASIVSVVIQYQEEIDNLTIMIDSFNMKRKQNIFEGKNYKDLNKISELLVSINYYYFYLAKQLWILKDKDRSDQQKKIFDNASLELLDVPRVTSIHKRDELGSYWEVTLLVTVELSEQSDEIIQHINMFVDKLMVIYKGSGKQAHKFKDKKAYYEARRHKNYSNLSLN